MISRISKIENSNYLIVSFLALYFIALPLGTVGLLKGFGSVLRLLALLPIAAIIFNKGVRYKINKITILQFMYTLVIFISMFYTIDFESTLQRTITNFQFFILLFFTGSVIFTKSDINVLKKSLVWASRITCIIMIIFGTATAESFDRLVLTSGIIVEDPNYLNGYLLFGIISSIEVILKEEKSKDKFVALVEIMFYLYASIATGSRGGLLSIIVGSVTIFLIQNNDKVRLKMVFRKVGLVILVAGIVGGIACLLPDVLTERYNWNVILEGRGSKRFDIWEMSTYIFKTSSLNKQLLGYGAGTIQYIYGQLIYMRVVSHNIFIEQLLEIGVLGLTVYVSVICSCLLKAKKEGNKFALAILIGFIVLSLSTSLYGFKPYWNAIIYTGLVCSNKRTLVRVSKVPHCEAAQA